MSDLSDALTQYLAMRRALAFVDRLPASLLRTFVAYVDQVGSPFITIDLARQWALQPTDAQPSTWAGRLSIARRFAVWRRASDPRTEVPPADLVGQRYRRKPPRLYRDQDVVRLIQSAAALPSVKKLRGRTYATLFGLLAVTGLRINEALHLDRSDVDLEAGVLLIRRTKFGKSRLVPIHPTTQEALRAYGEARDQMVPRPVTPAFFVSERRTRITEWITRYTFAVVSRTVGLRPPTSGGRHGRGPRIQDLRHRFAAQTLIAWYRAGVDVERELPKLSTYLGHVHTADTYWYLEAIPELLQLAAERLTPTPPEVTP
ncbi:MAG: tyrosine-type recombinase/integrase [Acidobacteria bacterium]|nr:tyrosine-type recombinase/integrase [Acidobacteriota bacterium]